MRRRRDARSYLAVDEVEEREPEDELEDLLLEDELVPDEVPVERGAGVRPGLPDELGGDPDARGGGGRPDEFGGETPAGGGGRPEPLPGARCRLPEESGGVGRNPACRLEGGVVPGVVTGGGVVAAGVVVAGVVVAPGVVVLVVVGGLEEVDVGVRLVESKREFPVVVRVEVRDG